MAKVSANDLKNLKIWIDLKLFVFLIGVYQLASITRDFINFSTYKTFVQPSNFTTLEIILPYGFIAFYLSVAGLFWGIFSKKTWVVLPWTFLEAVRIALEVFGFDGICISQPGYYFYEVTAKIKELFGSFVWIAVINFTFWAIVVTYFLKLNSRLFQIKIHFICVAALSVFLYLSKHLFVIFSKFINVYYRDHDPSEWIGLVVESVIIVAASFILCLGCLNRNHNLVCFWIIFEFYCFFTAVCNFIIKLIRVHSGQHYENCHLVMEFIIHPTLTIILMIYCQRLKSSNQQNADEARDSQMTELQYNEPHFRESQYIEGHYIEPQYIEPQYVDYDRTSGMENLYPSCPTYENIS